jgi:PAS domain S-box-containing protein
MSDDPQRELLGRLLAVQQQNIDLRARLDLEHQAGEGFLRFGERALGLDGLEAFWDLAAEELVSTFGTESGLVLRLEDDGGTTLCATSCLDAVTPPEVAALGACVRRGLRERRVYGESPSLPALAGEPMAFALSACFIDRTQGGGTYALVGVVSVAKRPFYPSMDEKLGPLFSAFANHAAALQQHVRLSSAARAVAARMQRLAEVANRTSNAVIVADVAGRIEWVNESFERLTGWSFDEVRGRRPGDFLQGPGTSPEARRIMAEAIAGLQPFDLEVANYTKDGRQYWVQIETRVLRDERGQPSGFVAVETDVTERRLGALHDLVAQRVAALLIANTAVDATVGRQLVEVLVDTLAPIGARAAHIWTAEPRRDTLVSLAGTVQAALGPAGETFLATTSGLTYRRGASPTPGVGVPGAAWGSGRVWFQSDLRVARFTSRRMTVAAAAGIDGLCAAPIVGPSGVIGVIEIASARGHAGFERLPAMLERVAEQVAAFMLQDESRRAFLLVFEQSPDGMLLVDLDGRVLAANARASALFGPLDARGIDGLIAGGRDLVAAATKADGPAGERLAAELHVREAHGARGAVFSAEVSVSATPGSSNQAAIIAVRDLTERHRMEAAVAQSLREKETLLKEIHHRVKNNLQIISSLLMLQVEQMPSPEARQLLEESVQRVRSMALIHQQIYGGESLERIDLAVYTSQLAGTLQNALAPDARLRLEVEPIEVTVEHAVPLGLILNELITNAFKYGAPPDSGSPPQVTVTIGLEDGLLAVTVRDSGPGLPPDFDPETATSLGLLLVDTLTRQLRGQLTVTNEGGAVFRLRCSVEEPPRPS